MNKTQTGKLLEEFVNSGDYPETWYPHLVDQFKTQELFDALSELTRYLTHEKGEYRSAASQLIIDLTRLSIAKYILPLLKDPDDNVRGNVCQSLSNYWSPEIEDALIENLRKDPDVNVRCNAISSLRLLRSRRSLDALLVAVAKDFDRDFENVTVSERARDAIHGITS